MTIKRKFALSSADIAPGSAPILLKGDLVSNLKEAASLGYQGLEVHTRETATFDYDEIKNVCDAYGIAISAIVTGRLNTQGAVSLIDDRPYITDAAMAGMGAYVRMAARLRSGIVIGWVKGKVPESVKAEPYLERLARNLKTICREAHEQGVKIFVEVINRYETNIFNTAEETLDFIDFWEIPNCYIHLDTFHMNIEEGDSMEAIRRCGKKLGYFHAADNTRCYPGTGTLDFEGYTNVLDEIGYDGYISIECLPKPDGKTAAAKALEYMKKLEGGC